MADAFDRLVQIMDRLRDPDGCPWDREQTLVSLAAYLLEEAYEAVEAVGSGDAAAVREELGDLMSLIVGMARIGSEQGSFDLDDVCHGISDKMIHRHPHVFGDTEVEGTREVLRNWEEIKRKERKKGPDASALDGVPRSLPGLLKAFRMTEKAAALGFDWQRPRDVIAKLREEVGELEAELAADDAGAHDRLRSEMGDVLFVMANLARHLGVEPETALQGTNAKFIKRFSGMEKLAREEGRELSEMSLSELDRQWERVKESE